MTTTLFIELLALASTLIGVGGLQTAPAPASDRPSSSEAYEQGRKLMRAYTPADIAKAAELFKQVIETDPRQARAHAALSIAYSELAYLGHATPYQLVPQAKTAAAKALELDDRLADAHLALALLKLYYEWSFKTAEPEFQRAIELDPKSIEAHLSYSACLLAMNRNEDALRESRRALELDPQGIAANLRLGLTLLAMAHHGEAEAQLVKLTKLAPNYYPAYLQLARAYVAQSKLDDATAAAQKARSLCGDDPSPIAYLGAVHAAAGRSLAAAETNQELNPISRERFVSPIDLARPYAAAADIEPAFSWLDKAFTDRSPQLLELPFDPMFKSLHKDPRWTKLLERIGLPVRTEP